jgi:glutamyl-Q tRNA(Asp) synthetase
MSQNIVSRFAPSPTGRLHLGHAWSALRAHDLARAAGGRFLLRIEDIDTGRCRSEYVDDIFEDLRWLGLNWDGAVMIQSERTGLYETALAQLDALGLVYRCWCTRAEIAASAPQGDVQPRYPGTCKGRAAAAGDGPHCWRLDMEKAIELSGSVLDWTEGEAKLIRANPLPHGDFIIARKDAATSYHLAVTIDDAAQGVTDVVRGTDLFASTHIHRLLQAVLGLPTPRYHHHPLIGDEEGERLAKRKRSPSLADLRNAGADPIRLIDGMRRGVFPVGFALIEA